MTQPAVSVVVVSYNSRVELLQCVASVGAHLGLPHELIVVDNCSSDGSVAALRAAAPHVQILENAENLGFGAANNHGVAHARAPYVLILNSDAELRPGTVERMAGILDDRPEVGIVGPRTVSADGSIQVSFGPMLSPVGEWRQRRLVRGVRNRRRRHLDRATHLSSFEHEPVWVSGSCFLARRRSLVAVGGFDEGFFLYEEDVDLCIRVRRAGWAILYTPHAEVMHHQGASMKAAMSRAQLEYQRSHLRFYEKHQGGANRTIIRAVVAVKAFLGLTRQLGPRKDPEVAAAQRELLFLALRRTTERRRDEPGGR